MRADSNKSRIDDSYRPLIMWFWNDAIEINEIEFQLRTFKQQGLIRVFIHPNYGFKETYLSDHYFSLFRHAVITAKKYGMKIWIYDEYNWPSGTAGGYVLQKDPWTRSRVVRVTVCMVRPGDRCLLKSSNEIVGVQAIYESDHDSSVDVINVKSQLQQLREGESIWQNKRGILCKVYIFSVDRQRGVLDSASGALFSQNTEGYLDTLDAHAVKQFHEVTHERYKQAVGEFFGDTIEGIFTDEPCISSPMDLGVGTFPWSRNFSEEFKKIAGYAIEDHLCALAYNFSDAFHKKVRYHYWRVVSTLFYRNYMEQTRLWCEQNGLLFTGHLIGEESVLWHTMQSGDYYQSLSAFHIPGIDSLFSNVLINDRSFNMVGKLASSVACFTQKERVLCETFSGSGYKLTLSDMKRVVNRLILLGINMHVLMGAHYSSKGFRKTTVRGLHYPPSHGWQNPLFPFYKAYSDYVSRLCKIHATTRYDANVLVMLPVQSVWEDVLVANDFLGYRGTPRFTTKDIEYEEDLCLKTTINALFEIHVSFLIGFDALMQQAKIQKNSLCIKGYFFKQVIVPYMQTIDEKTCDVLRTFAEQGGRVLWINRIPEITSSESKKTQLMDLFDESAKKTIHQCMTQKDFDKPTLIHSKKSGASFLSLEVRKHGQAMEPSRRALQVFSEPFAKVRVRQSGIRVCHRSKKHKDVFLVVNDTDQEIEAKITICATGALSVLNPNTGESYSVESRQTQGETIVIWGLAAYDAIVLTVDHDFVRHKVSARECEISHTDCTQEQQHVNLPNPRFETVSDHRMPLSYLWPASESSVLVNENRNLVEWSAESAQTIWQKGNQHQFPIRPSYCTGDSYICKSEFWIESIPQGGLRLLYEQDEPIEHLLNGKAPPEAERTRVYHPDNRICDITSLVRRGKNELLMKSRIPFQPGIWQVPHHAICGKFCICNGRIIQPSDRIEYASWTKQGYLHYSGTGRYEVFFSLPFVPHNAVLVLDTKDVVRVCVNQKNVGVRVWPPYTFDITKVCKKGNNRLVIEVTCRGSNPFEQSLPSGLLSKPKLSFV